MSAESREQIRKLLNERIRFQRRWRTATMALNVFCTIGSLAASTIGTIVGAVGNAFGAAVCAAVATLLITTEKSLLFRLKWRLHTQTAVQLESLQADLLLDSTDEKTVIARMNEISGRYASELPFDQPFEAGQPAVSARSAAVKS